MQGDFPLREWEGNTLGIECLLHGLEKVHLVEPEVTRVDPDTNIDVHRVVSKVHDLDHGRRILVRTLIRRDDLFEYRKGMIDVVLIPDAEDNVDSADRFR